MKTKKKIVDLKKELTRLFNKKVRLRDTNFDDSLIRQGKCISCDNYVAFGAANCHAGHYVPAGNSTRLKWEDDNVNVQCCTCNTWKRGNPHEYRKGMIEKYGEEREREIWAMRHEIMKPDREWLEKKIEENKLEIINLSNFK